MAQGRRPTAGDLRHEGLVRCRRKPFLPCEQPVCGAPPDDVARAVVGTRLPVRFDKPRVHQFTASRGNAVDFPAQHGVNALVGERAEGFDKYVSLDVIFKHLSSVYGNSLLAGVTLDG